MVSLTQVMRGWRSAYELQKWLIHIRGMNHVHYMLIAPVTREVVENERDVELKTASALLHI